MNEKKAMMLLNEIEDSYLEEAMEPVMARRTFLRYRGVLAACLVLGVILSGAGMVWLRPLLFPPKSVQTQNAKAENVAADDLGDDRPMENAAVRTEETAVAAAPAEATEAEIDRQISADTIYLCVLPAPVGLQNKNMPAGQSTAKQDEAEEHQADLKESAAEERQAEAQESTVQKEQMENGGSTERIRLIRDPGYLKEWIGKDTDISLDSSNENLRLSEINGTQVLFMVRSCEAELYDCLARISTEEDHRIYVAEQIQPEEFVRLVAGEILETEIWQLEGELSYVRLQMGTAD